MGLLQDAARKGRGGDTRVAHVTPGEVVIPKEMVALRPDLVLHVMTQLKQMGGNPKDIIVGRGRVNPSTGIEEFATAEEVEAAYQAILGRAPDTEGLAYWTSPASNFSTETFSKAAIPEISVSQAYKSNFGRPAETKGLQYWVDYARNNPNVDMGAQIGANALGQDITAKADKVKDSLSFTDMWKGNKDANSPDLFYDVERNQWNPTIIHRPLTPTTTSPTLTPTTTSPTLGEPVVEAEKFTGLTREIRPAVETIEGRIRRLLSANNPVIMQAKNRALQDFHRRGLLDTSMAAQAAQEAMTAKAIDIAGPDAAAYQTQGMLNQTEGNKSSIMDQEYGLKGRLQEQIDAAALKRQAQSDAAALERQVQSDAAALERAITGQQTQDTSANARMFTEGILNINKDYTARIETIQQNTNMDAAQKADAVQVQTDLRDSAIQAWNGAASSLPGWREEWAVTPSYSVPSVQPATLTTEGESAGGPYTGGPLTPTDPYWDSYMPG